MSVNKVQLANGETIIDISDSTVTPETLAEGVTAHDASGQKITGKMVPGGGSSVQSDWNQNDENAADFIKNKTHYRAQTTSEIIPETEMTGEGDDADGYVAMLDVSLFSGNEEKLLVVLDGVEYACTVQTVADNPFVFFGNLGLGDMGADSGEPFFICIGVNYGYAMMLLTDGEPHTVSISAVYYNFVKINSDYVTTVFYADPSAFTTGNNSYIYADANCTIKVTKQSIIDTINLGLPLAIETHMRGVRYLVCFPVYVSPYADEWSEVGIYYGNTVLVLRTAEYTPPTT